MTDPFAPPDSSPPAPPPWGQQQPPAWGPPPASGPPPPPWGHPQPWYGGWPPARRRTNPLAVAALVTGILALVPIAVGLAIAAVVQVGRRRDEEGRGLAIAGIAISGFWTLVVAVVAAAALSGVFDYSREGNLDDVASTTVGTCLHKHPSRVAECSSSHEQEVFSVPALPEGPWPGEDEIDSEADDLCYYDFEKYVGIPYDDSDFDYTFYAPSEQEWSRGRHEVVCVVTPFGNHLRGSVKGSRR